MGEIGGGDYSKEIKAREEIRTRYLKSINNYNCTLSVMADRLGIKLWVAMEIGRWANKKREREEEWLRRKNEKYS